MREQGREGEEERGEGKEGRKDGVSYHRKLEGGCSVCMKATTSLC